ncbi:hypothetical protein NFI96_025214, partial [Prochilodus magdalenae]
VTAGLRIGHQPNLSSQQRPVGQRPVGQRPVGIVLWALSCGAASCGAASCGAVSCGQRPVGSVLWGSVLWGSVLWGSVLWGSVLRAASCGQRPVTTDEGLEDDQHCTVQQQMSYEMELSSCLVPPVIKDGSLCPVSWSVIGAGGFGEIYRAKHTKWQMDVAIKLLRCRDGSGSSLLREADLMRHGGSPYVLRILGVYEGCPPRASSTQLGLVMEYMERGSLANLQRALNGPPPWPLTFRIMHQIALGMNFLHQLSPPLLHLDLKPSNVLLDDSLNAKVTDFGLAKVARSASRMASERDEETGGTTSYMPPEAFQKSSPYVPSFSSDIYSYGILLWSVITGKEPYESEYPSPSLPLQLLVIVSGLSYLDAPCSSLVRFRIHQGDRPDLTNVDSSQVAGLSDMVELMKQCWDDTPERRPPFTECVKATKKVFDLHYKHVHDDVCAIQKKLDNKDRLSSGLKSLHITPRTQNGRPKENSHHPAQTGATPVQDTSGLANSRPNKPAAARQPTPACSGTNHKPAAKAPPRVHRAPGVQRVYSTPGNVSIELSNVTGVQIGNNNHMNISVPPERPRRRHPTAPSYLGQNSQPTSKYSQNSQQKP